MLSKKPPGPEGHAAGASAGGPWAAFRAAHLFDYNPAATRLWLALAAAGALAIGVSLALLARRPLPEIGQLAGWLAIAALAAAFPIQIPRSKLSIAAADVVVYLLLALHGAPAAVIAAAVEGLVAACRTSRRLTSRVATASAGAVALAAGGLLFELATAAAVGGPLPAGVVHLLALTLAATLHFALSTGVLMQILHLKNGLVLSLRDWFAGASWMGTLHLVSAVVAGLLALNARHIGYATAVVGLVVIAASLLLLRVHFRQQIAEHEAQEARVAAAEHDAQQNLRRFHSAFSQASIGMAIVSRDGYVVQVNRALNSLLGLTRHTLLRRPFGKLLAEGDAELLARHVAELQAGRCETFSIELRCFGADGAEIWVSLHCAPFDDDGSGSGGGLIYQLHDISSRRRAEGELRHIAYHDALTDLANRNGFQQRLAMAVERSRDDAQVRFAVMMLDLDRFKVVNDSLGHAAGDALLKEVARRLCACVRPRDLVTRLGGDEFAVLLEGAIGHDEAVQLGHRLLDALADPMVVNGTEMRPSASIGLTLSDMGYRDPDEVLRDADLAMYRAKSDGKARLAVFDASLHEQLGHKLQLEADLRRAIGDGQLTLAYQPLFELEAHRLIAFEALTRWTHPVRGAVSPAVFIAIAEESGCIEALTAWAIDEAVRQHAAWVATAGAAQRQLAMHVNVSGRDLSQPAFVPHVRAVLARHGLSPGLLVLEITESTLMEHRDLALRALGELTALGVKVGIDDFGTGYSSLAYLSVLPFDCLKIDRSFVLGMARSWQNVEIVRTVISLGRTLNKQVVAEGIETHEQLAQVRQLGATAGQGYLLSRPLTPSQVRQLLDEPQGVPA